MRELPRLSRHPLPPYRFKKRRDAHPSHDPEGHFYGRIAIPCPDFGEETWRDCEDYLFALDLFNHRYFWECHDVLEQIWHDMNKDEAAAQFIQTFIQCTIAHWHADSGRSKVACKLLDRIPEHASRARGVRLGLDIEDLHAATRAFVADPGTTPFRILPK